MPEKTIAPWYSMTGDVYHVRSDCESSRGVPTGNRLPGTRNRRICRDCLELLQREYHTAD